jgi:hypothetical protein
MTRQRHLSHWRQVASRLGQKVTFSSEITPPHVPFGCRKLIELAVIIKVGKDPNRRISRRGKHNSFHDFVLSRFLASVK